MTIQKKRPVGRPSKQDPWIPGIPDSFENVLKAVVSPVDKPVTSPSSSIRKPPEK